MFSLNNRYSRIISLQQKKERKLIMKYDEMINKNIPAKLVLLHDNTEENDFDVIRFEKQAEPQEQYSENEWIQEYEVIYQSYVLEN